MELYYYDIERIMIVVTFVIGFAGYLIGYCHAEFKRLVQDAKD